MKRFRYILFMIVAFAISGVATAQELKVVSFERLLTDVTARSTAVRDGNGDICALIKVSLPVAGCEFAGNIVGKPEFHVSEYWVYMTPSSKKLTIRCPGCESLNAGFGIGVESAVTYHLRLSGYPTAADGSKKQPVSFKITPADAVLTIDQNEHSTQNGIAQIMLSPGEHAYAVFAPGYNVQGSKFMVYENNNNKIFVELEPKAQSAGNLQSSQSNAVVSSPSVSSSSNTINGHDYVDLGLPSGVKWATCNVGASSPSGYGDYFAWGETTIKTEYTEENSKTWEKSLGDISGNPQYDVARSNWGSSWRLPSAAELEELRKKCTWTWTSQDGHNGYKVTGPNGKSIFLPAAGCRIGSSLYGAGDCGGYWGSTPTESGTERAGSLYFDIDSSDHRVDDSDRPCGLSVRPVSE